MADIEGLVEGDRIGEYRVVEPITDSVFKVVHQDRPEAEFAMKVRQEKGGKRMLSHEREVLSYLKHKNIIPIVDFGEAEHGGETLEFNLYPYICAFYRGHLVSGDIDELNCLRIIRSIADVCADIHRQGVIHRDIKPSNILVPADLTVGIDYTAMLTDFELARKFDESQKRNEFVEGIVMGTPNYMSPEQAKGRFLGPATDVFSLGLTLYEMLTGEDAITGETTAEMVVKIAKGYIEAYDHPVEGVSPEIGQLVKGMIEYEMFKRPTMLKVVAEIGRIERLQIESNSPIIIGKKKDLPPKKRKVTTSREKGKIPTTWVL